MSKAKTTDPVGIPASSLFGVGDPIYIIFWREHYVDLSGKIDQGNWDVLEGTFISGSEKRICYELTNKSTPARWGGDFDGNEGSALRFVSHDRVFATREAAEKAKENKPRPEKAR